MAATGLNDGEYMLGDLPVSVKDKKATLSDGTIAGSSKNLFEQVKYALSIGIDPKKVIKSATEIPAKALNLDAGIINIGKKADFCILNKNFDIISVYKNGKLMNL